MAHNHHQHANHENIKLAFFLEQKPLGIPGKQHQADASYYRRIEAIEFTVKHDDGQAPHTLNKADLVLVGLGFAP